MSVSVDMLDANKNKQTNKQTNKTHTQKKTELNSGLLTISCQSSDTELQPPALTILYMSCAGATECLSRTASSHTVGMS